MHSTWEWKELQNKPGVKREVFLQHIRPLEPWVVCKRSTAQSWEAIILKVQHEKTLYQKGAECRKAVTTLRPQNPNVLRVHFSSKQRGAGDCYLLGVWSVVSIAGLHTRGRSVQGSANPRPPRRSPTSRKAGTAVIVMCVTLVATSTAMPAP